MTIRSPLNVCRVAALGVVSMLGACGGTVRPMTLQQYMALTGPAPSAHISYGDAPSQFVELFTPAGEGPFPVVVLIHGGCFSKNYEGIVQMRGMAGALSSQGVAVWSIEYRRLDEIGGGYPGTFQDVNSAMDALAREAPARRLDTGHLVAMGHSVGGFLALWLAAREHIHASSPLHQANPLPVRNVISLGGTGDLRTQTVNGTTRCGYQLAQLTGQASTARPDVFSDTMPAQLVPNGSRTVLINGDSDTYSPPAEAAQYAARIRQSGDSAQTVVLPRASHFDEVAVSSPSWNLILPHIRQALESDAGP